MVTVEAIRMMLAVPVAVPVPADTPADGVETDRGREKKMAAAEAERLVGPEEVPTAGLVAAVRRGWAARITRATPTRREMGESDRSRMPVFQEVMEMHTELAAAEAALMPEVQAVAETVATGTSL